MSSTMRDLLASNTAQAQMSSFFIDKLGLVSVKSYGATGDGATNDTVAIQSCIAAATSEGLESIFFPHGTYLVTAGLGNELSGFFLWGDNTTVTGDTITINQIGANLTTYITAFTGLTDTPASFGTYAEYGLVVNAAEDGLEFIDFSGIYAAEDAEALRVIAEGLRVTAESLRVTAEDDRDTAEGLRVTAEGLRVTAEGLRVTAESGRVDAEALRVTAEGLRVTAEGLRVTAEGLRVTAESDRDTAEGLRVTAEGLRVTAEGLRVTAEGLRVTAESARVAAEILREQFTYIGAYSAGTTYVTSNMATYNGSTYICTQESTGNLPTNVTYWDVVAAKGADGIGAGDMLATTYDPTTVSGDAFDMDNMAEGSTTKILTATERTAISTNSDKFSYPGSADATELNILEGATLTTAELNILDGVTSDKDELNILDGATLTTTELNYVDGVTSAIQTQLGTITTSIATNLENAIFANIRDSRRLA